MNDNEDVAAAIATILANEPDLPDELRAALSIIVAEVEALHVATKDDARPQDYFYPH